MSTTAPRPATARLSNGEAIADLARAEEGLISRRIFADPEVYALEQERIFARGWFFIGHESEIPEPGDLVTRSCGIDPVILVRDDEGVVRVFLNSCRHRGMRVCRTDRENASFLRCPYHGWAYKNDGRLMTAAAEEHYEEGELDKPNLGLIPVAKHDSYQGLIFATWDPEAPDLDDFLGDMKYYLDIIVGRTGGVEVLGPPQVWDVETGWKFATDNFTDNFHVFSAHHSLVELGMLPNDPDFASHGHMIVAEEGHILHLTGGAPTEEYELFGLPHELRAQIPDHLTPEQVEMARRTAYSAGTVWPNFHWLQLMSSGTIGQRDVPFLNFRLEVPISPTRTRMWSWLAVDRDASPEFRKATYETYARTFGPAGIYDQDDMENWEDCTRAALGPAAKQHTLHHTMGIAREIDESWPGPGRAYADAYGEMTQRSWYAAWRTYMTREHRGDAGPAGEVTA
ncbi:MAG TPA: Rieske 2Fe-2S domain-containing protein [Conexibacter sp.]|nr:Rieske 2Fe-2S domain-containing protein [Conexibacter sp.]